jgi:hypothetical protein
MNSPNLAEVDPRLTGRLVAKRYAVDSRTLLRWKNDAQLGFPKPALTVHGRNYWALSALEAWEQSLPRKKSAAA